MSGKTRPYYLANCPRSPNSDLEVTDKYTGEVIARVAVADDQALDRAVKAASDAAGRMRDLKPYERQRILLRCVERFTRRAEELAQALCA